MPSAGPLSAMVGIAGGGRGAVVALRAVGKGRSSRARSRLKSVVGLNGLAQGLAQGGSVSLYKSKLEDVSQLGLRRGHPI